jgi:hypothetical protein
VIPKAKVNIYQEEAFRLAFICHNLYIVSRRMKYYDELSESQEWYTASECNVRSLADVTHVKRMEFLRFEMSTIIIEIEAHLESNP